MSIPPPFRISNMVIEKKTEKKKKREKKTMGRQRKNGFCQEAKQTQDKMRLVHPVGDGHGN